MNGSDRDLEALATCLGEAVAVAGALGTRKPLGVRAIEVAEGQRAYLVAFDGPRFLAVNQDMAPISTPATIRMIASAALLVERAEDEIDVASLHALAKAGGRLIAGGELEGVLGDAVHAVAEAALRLGAWRGAPGRVVASLPEIDQAALLHERLRGCWASFTRLSGPLAEHQDDLSASLVAGLSDLEACAAACAANVPLTGRLTEWLDDCNDGADQILASYMLPGLGQ